MAKITISINDDLLKRLDTYADNNYMTRSGFFSVSAIDYLNQKEAISAIKDVSLAVRKIADNGKIDSASLEKIEDFERMVQLFLTEGIQ